MKSDPTPAEWQRLSPELDALLELPQSRRAERLAGAFPDEPALRETLAALLCAHARAGDFLETPLAQAAPLLFDALSEAEEVPGPQALVGPWRVVQELGRGGMGVVYLAERADGQFRQRAALKLARAGLAGTESLACFRRERQILARLEHPHIARLLDGGVAEDGRPYFAMEYVPGRPLLGWCDARRAGVEERLRLFVKVCGAVQFAHRNLVVHRDLKPANVLVGEDGEPRLLDFGIAKLLADDPEEAGEALTRAGQLALTPEYAAPEQKRGEPVTTATDVYALGLLLFELLTGRRPVSLEGVDAGGSTTARPSSVVGLADAHPRAAARGLTPQRLARRLRGDLDTIVEAALRPEPARRYASAEALASDVERHLAGLPVSARRATLGYRMRSFVRRHRVGVAATLLVAVTVAGGVGATLWQTRARLREARKAHEVGEFLVSLFHEADPDQARGRTVTAEEILDRGARRIELELRGQPQVQAELLTVVGRIYVDLGLYERAVALLQPAVALRRRQPESAELAQSLWRLGQAQMGRGELDAAERSLHEALGAVRATQAESAEAARIQKCLGALLRERGRYDESEGLVRGALAVLRRRLGEDHPDVADALAEQAYLQQARGDYGQAAARLREALAVMRRGPRAASWESTSMLNRLGAMLREGGALDEAAAAHAEALATLRQVLGEGHPAVATTMHDLGVVMLSRGDLVQAAALHQQAVEIYRRRLGSEHPWLATALHDLARVRLSQGDPARAEPLLREALEIYRKALGPDHEFVAMALTSLAGVRTAQHDAAAAEPLLRQALAIYRRALPRDHPVIGTALVRLGELLVTRGKPAEAEPLLREALDDWLAAFGGGDRRIVEAQLQLGVCFTALRRYPEAEALLLAAYETLGHASRPGGPGDKASAAMRLAALYERWGRVSEAARYRLELPARAQAGRTPVPPRPSKDLTHPRGAPARQSRQ